MSRLVTEGLRTICGGPFSFSVNPAECLALSGPSGCGKTLLLRAIADLDPAEGDVLFDGQSRDSMPAPQWRRNVGWLPAESAWWSDVVGDHFRDQRSEIRDQKSEIRGQRADVRGQGFRFLEKLGFGQDVLGWRIERMSTGERQRLALFRLLENGPKVLLLDEPTAALDRKNVHLAEDVIAEYRQATGAAVIWISHDPEQVARIADRHLVFKHGLLEAAQ